MIRKWGAAVAAAALSGVVFSLVASADSGDWRTDSNLIPVGTNNLYDPLLVGTPVQAQQTAECQQDLAHQPTGNLTKAYVRSEDNGDGTTTYTYSVTTTRNPQTTSYSELLDCGVAVNSGNMYETQTATPFSGTNGVTTTVTLTVATSDEVCDRVELTGTDQTTGGFSDYSNEVGVAGGVEDDALCTPAGVTPEAPLAALLIPIGFGALGAAWLVNRRHSRLLS